MKNEFVSLSATGFGPCQLYSLEQINIIGYIFSLCNIFTTTNTLRLYDDQNHSLILIKWLWNYNVITLGSSVNE